MQIEIRSLNPLGKETLRKIQDIFREAECPNEALRAINGFVKFDGHTVYLGSATGIYSNTIDVEARDQC